MCGSQVSSTDRFTDQQVATHAEKRNAPAAGDQVRVMRCILAAAPAGTTAKGLTYNENYQRSNVRRWGVAGASAARHAAALAMPVRGGVGQPDAVAASQPCS